MEIKKAEFFRSVKNEALDTGLSEFAVAGKSNVGKSSLINMLTNNGKLARTSKQPGKTRLINYFLLNNEFFMVDLPGYGFAKVSKQEKLSWSEMMEGYFATAKNLKAVLLLLDIRHAPTQDDLMMLYYIEHYAIPYIIVATKADKIAKSKRAAQAAKLRKLLPTSFEYKIVPVSSELKTGKEQLLAELEKYLVADSLDKGEEIAE